ncbi:MAG: hypothetical protein ACREQJ_04055 [Candidatus Binatia bacterium]
MKRFLVAVLVAASASAPAATPEPYVPLGKGTIWVHEHRATYTGPGERKVFANVVTEVEGEEIIGGKTYMRMVRRYEGMPGVDRITVYRRAAPEGVYIAARKDGKLREALELALPPAVGGSWDYDDGVVSKRQVADVVALDTPAGHFEKCLKVVRDFLTDVRRKNYSQETYYCPGVGEVKSVLVQNTPNGKVVTEETLIKSSLFAPAPKR